MGGFFFSTFALYRTVQKRKKRDFLLSSLCLVSHSVFHHPFLSNSCLHFGLAVCGDRLKSVNFHRRCEWKKSGMSGSRREKSSTPSCDEVCGRFMLQSPGSRYRSLCLHEDPNGKMQRPECGRGTALNVCICTESQRHKQGCGAGVFCAKTAWGSAVAI